MVFHGGALGPGLLCGNEGYARGVRTGQQTRPLLSKGSHWNNGMKFDEENLLGALRGLKEEARKLKIAKVQKGYLKE